MALCVGGDNQIVWNLARAGDASALRGSDNVFVSPSTYHLVWQSEEERQRGRDREKDRLEAANRYWLGCPA